MKFRFLGLLLSEKLKLMKFGCPALGKVKSRIIEGNLSPVIHVLLHTEPGYPEQNTNAPQA